MPQFTDMMGHQILLDTFPKRIVSVVPSQTELLYDLGLDEEVIGITKFCVHPEEWFRKKTRVGGTKTLKVEEIVALRPDLVIANKEENTQEDIAALQKHIPVWVSDINTMDDAIAMIKAVGTMVNKFEKAFLICARLQADFNTLPEIFNHKKVAYFIWKDPWMAAAQGTFIDSVLQSLGAVNAFGDKFRYPEVELTALKDVDCVLLSSEPYPFKEQHLQAIQMRLPQAKVMLVDGEMFSWYGSRMLQLKEYLNRLVF